MSTKVGSVQCVGVWGKGEVKGRDPQPGLHTRGLFEVHKHGRRQIAGWDGLIIHPSVVCWEEMIMILTHMALSGCLEPFSVLSLSPGEPHVNDP